MWLINNFLFIDIKLEIELPCAYRIWHVAFFICDSQADLYEFGFLNIGPDQRILSLFFRTWALDGASGYIDSGELSVLHNGGSIPWQSHWISQSSSSIWSFTPQSCKPTRRIYGCRARSIAPVFLRRFPNRSLSLRRPCSACFCIAIALFVSIIYITKLNLYIACIHSLFIPMTQTHNWYNYYPNLHPWTKFKYLIIYVRINVM